MRRTLITGFRAGFSGDSSGFDVADNDILAAFTVATNLGLDLESPQEEGVVRIDTPTVRASSSRAPTPL